MGRIGKLVITLLLCLMVGTAASAEGAVNLPAQLLEIKAEAFFGDTTLRRVIIPESVEKIGERAFAYSAVREVVLPPSLTEMAADAFEGCEGIVAVVHAGSYAHAYCEENDVAFIRCLHAHPEEAMILLEKAEDSPMAGFREELTALLERGFRLFFDRAGGDAADTTLIRLLVEQRVHAILSLIARRLDDATTLRYAVLLGEYGDAGFAGMMRKYHTMKKGSAG